MVRKDGESGWCEVGVFVYGKSVGGRGLVEEGVVRGGARYL